MSSEYSTAKIKRIQIFIGYGGGKAENVAADLHQYLGKYSEDINRFLASRKVRDIHSSDEFVTFFEKLDNCDIAVFVCDSKTPQSKPVKDEIKRLIVQNQKKKIITFSKADDCIPDELKEIVHLLHYPPEAPEESFHRVAIEVFRKYIRNQQIDKFTKKALHFFEDDYRRMVV